MFAFARSLAGWQEHLLVDSQLEKREELGYPTARISKAEKQL